VVGASSLEKFSEKTVKRGSNNPLLSVNASMDHRKRAERAGFTPDYEFIVVLDNSFSQVSFLSKYRNRLEIIADILNIAKDGARKTQIMYKGNLSYKLLTRYLREVVISGLVHVRENAKSYELTEKGQAFLRHFESYSKSCKEVKQHLSDMNSQRATLEEMCAFEHTGERRV